MKRFFQFLLLAAGPLPYLSKLPYMLRAWGNSPMDRWDVIAPPAAFLAVLIALRGTGGRRLADSIAPLKFLPLVAALLLFVAAQLVSVNSIAILAAAAFWWCCCFAALAPDRASALLPAFLILCLGCTSSTYWLGYLLSASTQTVWLIKGAAAAVLLVLAVLRIPIRFEISAFIACFAAGIVWWNSADILSRTSGSLLLDIRRPPAGCLVRKQPASESIKRFFRNTAVRSFSIADDNAGCHLLEISGVKDIHEIHPAGHCLRSSGREILSERTMMLRVKSRKIPVTVIMTRWRGGRELVAVWYSTPVYSCSSFLAFRRHWRPDGKWRIYQISIPAESSESEAFLRLESLIIPFVVP